MERLQFDLSAFGEGSSWLKCDAILDEERITAAESKLREDMKQLLFPETTFIAPGMDRRAGEDEIESGESSAEELDEFTDVEPIAS
jgi:hypothetical protein